MSHVIDREALAFFHAALRQPPTMHQYLQDTEFAAQSLIQLASDEERQLRSIAGKLGDRERELKLHDRDFQTADLSDDFSEAYVMAAFARTGRAAQELDRLKGEVAVLQARVGTHQYSVQAIAGAILQIAKQGIALVHGKPSSAPRGRSLGSIAVRDIIWQARNQSMHYEEGKFTQPLLDLFLKLGNEQGPQFSLVKHPKQNRAKQIIDLLGWNDYGSYLQDMKTLLP